MQEDKEERKNPTVTEIPIKIPKKRRRRKKLTNGEGESDFSIEPIKGQKMYNFADTIPMHPCRMLLVGPSQLSGKTTVLFSLLSKRFPYSTFYGPDNIYIVCETIWDDARWRKFKINVDNIRDKWDPKFMEEIEAKVSKNKQPSLLICDDIIPIPGSAKDNAPFHAIFTRGRHYGENKKTGGGLSIWVTTQYYKALSPIVRSNCSNMCVWLLSDSEAIKLYEEHSNGLTKDEWMYIYKYCTIKPHSFLHINYANPSRVDGRFCFKYEKVIQISGHDDEDIEEKRIDEAHNATDIDIKESNKNASSKYNEKKTPQ